MRERHDDHQRRDVFQEYGGNLRENATFETELRGGRTGNTIAGII